MCADIRFFHRVLIVIVSVCSLAACGGGGGSAGSGDSGGNVPAAGMSVGNSVSVVDAK